MALTASQEDQIREAAKANGDDPEEIIRELNAQLDSAPDSGEADAAKGGGPPAAEQPKLFQYHLPFVFVREVRAKWLGLTEPFPGDDEVAAEWSAKVSGGTGAPPTDNTGNQG